MRFGILIPARANSKGIKSKNLTQVFGHPLVAWSIHQGIYLGDTIKHLHNMEADIFISSDSDRIIDIARAYCPEIMAVKRPNEISHDWTPTEEAITHWWEEHPDYDVCILLQPTSPVRTEHTMDKIINTVVENGCDSVFTVGESNPHLVDHQGNLMFLERHMRQMRPKEAKFYFDAGNIYAFRKEAYQREGNRICGDYENVLVSKHETFEIDTIDDVAYAVQAIKVANVLPPIPPR